MKNMKELEERLDTLENPIFVFPATSCENKRKGEIEILKWIKNCDLPLYEIIKTLEIFEASIKTIIATEELSHNLSKKWILEGKINGIRWFFEVDT